MEGSSKLQKLLLRQWVKSFANSESKAQAEFKAGDEQDVVTDETQKQKMKSGQMIFKIKSLIDSGKTRLQA